MDLNWFFNHLFHQNRFHLNPGVEMFWQPVVVIFRYVINQVGGSNWPAYHSKPLKHCSQAQLLIFNLGSSRVCFPSEKNFLHELSCCFPASRNCLNLVQPAPFSHQRKPNALKITSASHLDQLLATLIEEYCTTYGVILEFDNCQ